MSSGKYDALCDKVQAETQATISAVMVVGGNAGSGFSCSYGVSESDEAEALIKLANLLDFMAAHMRRKAGELPAH